MSGAGLGQPGRGPGGFLIVWGSVHELRSHNSETRLQLWSNGRCQPKGASEALPVAEGKDLEKEGRVE